MDILDKPQVLAQRDPDKAYEVISTEWQQVALKLTIDQPPTNIKPIEKLVVTGMGGSGLASDMAKDWLDLAIPYEVVKGYDLPTFVDSATLVIVSSFSGNTEETLSTLEQALAKGAQIAIITKGGLLLEEAKKHNIPYIQMHWDYQPRMGMFINLNALTTLLVHFKAVDSNYLDELSSTGQWLEQETQAWVHTVPSDQNVAKQMAFWCAGKIPMIYAGTHIRSLAYKWKISFNENSKNIAFWNEVPEFDHNEFLGWSSHPVEKPFAVIDLRSSLDHPRITKRFETGERLLSGLRPTPKVITLRGETRLQQLLWGAVLADFVSVYLGILNGVDPMKVNLIEKFKKELS